MRTMARQRTSSPAPLGEQPVIRTPAYASATRTCDKSYCHRSAEAVWSEPRNSENACGTCHGLPPAAPHPQSQNCSVCHGEVIDAARHFIAPERHVNGVVDYTAGDCKQLPRQQRSERSPAARHAGQHWISRRSAWARTRFI